MVDECGYRPETVGLLRGLQEAYEIGTTVGSMIAQRDSAYERSCQEISDEQRRYDTLLRIVRGD